MYGPIFCAGGADLKTLVRVNAWYIYVIGKTIGSLHISDEWVGATICHDIEHGMSRKWVSVHIPVVSTS